MSPAPPDTAALAQRAAAAGRIGIDTEFMTEGRYRPLLCLVQLALPDERGGAEIVLLDPLRDEFDRGPLARVLADPDVEVVLHAGRQDVAILRRELQTEIGPIFDTQIAAGFAGQPAQAGYGNLLRALLGVRISKSASYTRWDARPLSEEQLRYARADVEHLLALGEELSRRLERAGRLEWAREECRALQEASDVRDPQTAYRRLGRVNGLSPRQRAVARELAAWRELTAEQRDKPLGTVLGDPAVVEAARRQPSDLDALAQIRGIHQGIIRRSGGEIIAAIERGRDAEPVPHEGARVESDPGDAPLIALAEALVRSRAIETELAYELIASRADLGPIVAAARLGRDEPAVRTLKGWRREVVGAELLELLAGRRELAVDGGGRLVASARGAASDRG